MRYDDDLPAIEDRVSVMRDRITEAARGLLYIVLVALTALALTTYAAAASPVGEPRMMIAWCGMADQARIADVIQRGDVDGYQALIADPASSCFDGRMLGHGPRMGIVTSVLALVHSRVAQIGCVRLLGVTFEDGTDGLTWEPVQGGCSSA